MSAIIFYKSCVNTFVKFNAHKTTKFSNHFTSPLLIESGNILRYKRFENWIFFFFDKVFLYTPWIST